MQILAKRLCWCGSGLHYEQCHKAFDQKLDDFRKKGYLVPPRAIIKNQAQIEGIKKKRRHQCGRAGLRGPANRPRRHHRSD